MIRTFTTRYELTALQWLRFRAWWIRTSSKLEQLAADVVEVLEEASPW